MPVQTTATATNLAAGTYTVTVTDANGCTTTAQATITQPAAALAASISNQTNVSCFGNATGSATASPTGGTSPYTFSWNTIPVQTTATATNLAAGTYTVTVTDAKGCATTAQATITQPANALSVHINPTNPACAGVANGSATAVPSGGTSPYTFSWNTNPVKTTATISNLGPGTYTVTVTDAHGCTATGQTTLTSPPALQVNVQTGVIQQAGGTTTITLTVSGGTPNYTVCLGQNCVQTASVAQFTVPAGTYSFTITDAHGCGASASNIVIPAPQNQLKEVNGNGTIPGLNGGDATFSINVQLPLKGGHHLFSYSDPSAHITIASTKTNIVTIDSAHAVLSGSAKLPRSGGGTVNFTITVTDGHPTPDTLSISCSNGYSNSGTVTSGFIDIHVP